MSKISSFKSIENKNDVYRGKNCLKKFCKYFKRRKLNYQQANTKNHMKMQKICYNCKEKFEDKYAKDKKYRKIRDCPSLSLSKKI